MSKKDNPARDRRSKERLEAERQYLEANGKIKLVDIAERLGLTPVKVRKWKSLDKWDEKLKKGERSTKKGNGTKKHIGAPYGNQNAKGNKGNTTPHRPPLHYIHGAYSQVFLDTLDEDEKELLESIPQDEEMLLIEQIQLFSIRERRIMQAINKYRNMDGNVALNESTRTETKRTFKDQNEKEEYEYYHDDRVRSGKALPGHPYELQTQTTNKDLIIARLEQELSNVQSKKTKAIDSLMKYRLERYKIENENLGNEAVEDWIEAVLEGELNEPE